jgi:ABC-type transporter Mla subunit MlaD
MEAESKYTYVGVALVVLVAALVFSIVWLNRTGARSDFNYYSIYFERQPLDGLQLGADVDMRGIKVGRVEDYALQAENINRVHVVVRTDRRAPVRTNTRAIVTRNFVTNIAKISLVTPEPLGPPLTAVPPGENWPIIIEGESNLDAIAGKVGRIGDMAADTLDHLNELLSPQNRQAFTQTLANLRDLTSGLNQRVADLDTTIGAFNTAAGEIGRAGTRAAQVAEDTGKHLQPTLQQAEQTLKDISTAAFSLEKQIAALATRFGDTATSTDEQLTAAVIELRTTVESMNRVFDRFQDPRAALLGAGRQQRGPGE